METQSLALVTGAGHRLGKAIALQLAKSGFAIGIHYFHSEQAAQETADEIQALGTAAYLFKADLSSEGEVEKLFEEVSHCPMPLQVLVNSASLMERGRLDEINVPDWDRIMNLNLRAPWLCAQRAAEIMHEGSVIINITDAGAGRLWTAFPVYSISKQGLELLTQMLAKTLAPKVRVNAVAPGLIQASRDTSPEEWEKLINRLPLKKSGNPEAIAEAILFLINQPYITGQTLVVDGGYQLT